MGIKDIISSTLIHQQDIFIF